MLGAQGGGGGGGYSNISHILRLGPFWGVQHLGFKYFCGFQKNEYFWGMKILWIFILEVNVQNWDISGVAKISNIFWGMPDIPDIFGVSSRCRV